MRKILLEFKSKSGNKVVEIAEGILLFAGRTLECDIYLPSPSVSRKHAVFAMRSGQCGVKDLDSSNGTYLNGKRLVKPSRLKEGDCIQIGGYSISLTIEHPPAFKDAAPTRVIPSGEAVQSTEPAPPPVAAQAADIDNSVRHIREAADRHVRHQTRIAERALRLPHKTSAGEIARDSLLLRQQTPEPPKAQMIVAKEEISVGTLLRQEETPDEAHGSLPCGLPFADDDSVDGTGDADNAYSDDVRTVVSDDAVDGPMDPDEVNALKDSANAGQSEGTAASGAMSEKSDFNPVFDSIGSMDLPPLREADPNAIPIDKALRDAIEARLYLYSFLNDMRKKRQELAAGLSTIPEAVRAELDRQDREMQKIPQPEKAEQMLQSRIARRGALKEKIAEAQRTGADMPPRPSKAIRQAEDIAINQWTIIAQSGREALPAAMREGFRVVASEPLADILAGVNIDAVTLMGGGAYYLALEQLQEETKYNRAFLRAKLAQLSSQDDKKAANAGGGLLGRFGKKTEKPAKVSAPAPGENYEELRDAEAHMADRVAWIAQELESLEPMLIKEFWSVYTKAALHFIPYLGEIKLALRAFLRYGVIGFMPWWMSEEVREHIMAECSRGIVGNLEVSRGMTNILYTDEYLAAVMRNECTPAPDENLEINAKNSPEWRADKALRRLINTRSQMTLLSELVDGLQERIGDLEREGAAIEAQVKGLAPGQKNFKQLRNELGQQSQAFKVEATKLTKLSEKIREETIARLSQEATEVEARFSSGELPRPTPEFLIERECGAVRKLGRLLANLKERFMPLVVRDSFHPGTDAMNDRDAIQGEIAEIERRDPRIFLETLVDSKKKANRVDLRISPVITLLPSAGILAFSWNPRQNLDDGRLAVPTCFIRRRLRERQMTYLMADFRWDTSKAGAGMDVMASETIVAAFMGVRWDWRKRSKEAREKGLVFTEQNDRTNWRRVYEAYLSTAYDSGKKLFNRNHDFYERIVGKYFDLPEGVELLRK